MSGPKRQHFIPRSYLRFFSESVDGKYFVDTILRGKDEEIARRSINDVCVQKNIYTFPTDAVEDKYTLEKFYAENVDSVYPQVQNILIDDKIDKISPEDKRKILNTILSLYFRTPRFLNYHSEKLDFAVNHIAESISDPNAEITIGLENGQSHTIKRGDLEEFKLQRRIKLKEKYLFGHFADWKKYVEYKESCDLEVINTEDGVPIISSDNPVSIMNLDGQINEENILDPNNIIEVPLNRTHYLVIYPNSVSDGGSLRIKRSRKDKRFGATVNLATEKNSDIRILGYPGDLHIHFDSQAKLGTHSEENYQAYLKQIDITYAANELMNLTKKHGTPLCEEVAEKVKELRKKGLMDDDETFKMLVSLLEQNGFVTN